MDTKVSLLKTDLTDLYRVLEPYRVAIRDAREHLRIKGKTIGQANYEQPGYYQMYIVMKKELEQIVKLVELDVNRVRGTLYRRWTENSNVELSERGKERYIEKEPEYLDAAKRLLEVEELAQIYDGIVKSFEQRGYTLRNLTDLRVNSLDDSMI